MSSSAYTVYRHHQGTITQGAEAQRHFEGGAPYTVLAVMQKEGADPDVVVIDTATEWQRLYKFVAPPRMAAFMAKSRSARVTSTRALPTQPTTQRQTGHYARGAQNGVIAITPLLEGNATAKNVVTGQTVTLNLQDPDPTTRDPLGNIITTSQADAELMLVRKPGTPDHLLRIPLTSPSGSAQADNTVLTPADDAVILVADTPANFVCEIH